MVTHFPVRISESSRPELVQVRVSEHLTAMELILARPAVRLKLEVKASPPLYTMRPSRASPPLYPMRPSRAGASD